MSLTFRNLTNIVYEQNKKYLTDLQYEFDEIEITSMWSNHLKPGQSHPPHTIQFFDPRPQANILSPRNEPNKYNASMMQV